MCFARTKPSHLQVPRGSAKEGSTVVSTVKETRAAALNPHWRVNLRLDPRLNRPATTASRSRYDARPILPCRLRRRYAAEKWVMPEDGPSHLHDPRGRARPPSKKKDSAIHHSTPSSAPLRFCQIPLPALPPALPRRSYPPETPLRLPLCFNSSGHWKSEKIIRKGEVFYFIIK
jgi:hypothetical protein